MNRFFTYIFIVFILIGTFLADTPLAFAQATSDAGQITSCSQNGQTPVSAGTVSAGGQYVPVFDQAVAQNTSRVVFNTGMLVYKECVLRAIINGQRKAATASIVANGTRAFMTGRNGGPMFVQNIQREKLFLASDAQIIRDLQENNMLAPLHDTFENSAKAVIGNAYYRNTRVPMEQLTCSYQGDLQSLYAGSPQGSLQDALRAMNDPACNPYFATEIAYQNTQASTRAATHMLETNVTWGDGIYPRVQLDRNGNMVFVDNTTVTAPARFVGDIQMQLLTSGFRQQEMANDINQMVTTLFSQVGTQVMSNNAGMTGLFQAGNFGGGGGGSFIDQIVSGNGGNLQNVTGNAAIQTLRTALSIEQSYNQVITAIATLLTNTIGQLRSVERQCWASMIQNTCVPSTISPNGTTCTSVTGVNLTRIATSTAFSQAVVNNNIAAAATSTTNNLNRSNAAITLLNTYIAAIQANVASQATIMNQYYAQAAAGAFHTQSDITAAQGQQQSITVAAGNLITDTINIWGGTDSNGQSTIPWNLSTYPGTGWCNYQSTSTIASWVTRWQ